MLGVVECHATTASRAKASFTCRTRGPILVRTIAFERWVDARCWDCHGLRKKTASEFTADGALTSPIIVEWILCVLREHNGVSNATAVAAAVYGLCFGHLGVLEVVNDELSGELRASGHLRKV
jgi:hypothetical protein